jgi:tetratricopeptide (TPR) repeat protein
MTATGLAAALGLALSQVAPADAAVEERIVTVAETVGDWGTEPDDWFRLRGLDARLMIPRGDERETHWFAIETVSERGIALRVRLDAGAGRLAPTGDHIVYPVCSIRIAGAPSFGDEARNCPPRAAAQNDSERLLAIGVVLAQERPDRARVLLSQALAATPRLTGRARALALKARAEAARWQAEDSDPDAPDHDRLMAEALADYRGLARLVPDNAGVQIAIAQALQALGGYREAHEVFRATRRRWPQEAFEVAVQHAALYRQQGDYRRALRILDDYARGGDSQATGMKFHYHRAWTLSLLGRNEEAVRHLDEGLATQPDYSAAYLLRSCVQARLGRLQQALADQRRGLALLEDDDEAVERLRPHIERSRAAIRALEGAIAGGRAATAGETCSNLWDRWSRPRPRSPLLGSG